MISSEKQIRSKPFQNTAKGECPVCQHWKHMHGQKGCQTCLLMIESVKRGDLDSRFLQLPYACREVFHSPLPLRELEQALAFKNRTMYDNRAVCACCGYYWMEHRGYLCPTMETTFVALFDPSLPGGKGLL